LGLYDSEFDWRRQITQIEKHRKPMINSSIQENGDKTAGEGEGEDRNTQNKKPNKQTNEQTKRAKQEKIEAHSQVTHPHSVNVKMSLNVLTIK
jgi:hypothetical protein